MGNYLQKKYLDEFKYIKSLKYMPDDYFVNGKNVRVINSKDYVKFIQSSYGGWDETMSECINQICTVVNVDHDKTILLISPSKRLWLFNRAALEPIDSKDYEETISFSIVHNKNHYQKQSSDEYLSVIEKIEQSNEQPSKPDTQNKSKDKKQAPILMKEFKVGDLLRVSSNEKLIQEKQQYCGGFSKMRMQDLIGKLVYVKHFSVRCVKVEKDGRDYDLHPDILDYPKSGGKDLPQKKNSNNMEKNANLFAAITDNDIDKLLQIIDKEILDIQNNVGRTPINLACCLGEQDMVEILLDFGADLNIADNNGNLPIHNCALKGHDGIVKFILQKCPDQINKQTQSGLSLLNIAKQKKNKDLERFLLTKNIDIINPTLHPASNSLDISLFNPPTTLTPNNEEAHDLPIRYISNIISASLMDPPKDEGNSNNLPISTEYETIAVPSMAFMRPSMANPSNLESITDSPVIENECTICRDSRMNVAFVKCGHVACKKCADRIFKCHICNSEIEDKIVIYL